MDLFGIMFERISLVPTFLPIFVAMVLTVLMLFNSVKKTVVIFMTLPLILVGVVAGLLVFDKPFGFSAAPGMSSRFSDAPRRFSSDGTPSSSADSSSLSFRMR